MVEKKKSKVVSTKATVSSQDQGKKKRKVALVNKQGRGKRYIEVAKLTDINKVYSLDEAIEVLLKTANVKFDSAIEAHIRTTLDPKQADQNLRGTVLMPSGIGKSIKILVFAEGAEAQASKKAGADYVGSDDLVDKIKAGWLDFNVAIATPEMMPRIGQIGKTLGTKGLMPNPKSGTVTKDPARAVEEFKKGKVEFKLDKEAIIHLSFGKVSLGAAALKENFTTLYKAIMAAKPASAKGAYIKKISLASTMGPGVTIDLISL
ncbi:50S ribosomal protein L1 [Patescibacteria group bacterium]|nr:50S ribosomal protein L1 [Patescibacteria group bacterium]